MSRNCLYTLLVFCQSFASFGQLLRDEDKRIVKIMKVYIERNNLPGQNERIVNIMKVYIERNNVQLDVIQYSQYKNVYVIHDGFTHRTPSRKFRTQTTTASSLIF